MEKTKAADIGEDGFLGPSQIGPTGAERGNGHVGPFDPHKGPKGTRDPLGYLSSKGLKQWGEANEEPNGS
jgi:hypothetical protein